MQEHLSTFGISKNGDVSRKKKDNLKKKKIPFDKNVILSGAIV